MHLLAKPGHRGARAVVSVLALFMVGVTAAAACDADEGPAGIELCPECASDPVCPALQPSINPLVSCEAVDAECFYCSTVTRRFVCRGANDTDDTLRWRDNGVAQMCPAPSAGDSSGTQ